ncbi:hypothetical protein D029_0350B, partial [Vibrio parahaemolyticus 970107]
TIAAIQPKMISGIL